MYKVTKNSLSEYLNHLDKFENISRNAISLMLNMNIRYGVPISYDIFEVVIMRMINVGEIDSATELFRYIKLALLNNNKVMSFPEKFTTYKDYSRILCLLQIRIDSNSLCMW